MLEKPEVINEISFETKGAVTNHMLMAGDSAGMIAPACGNEMAMAIHSGKLVSQLVEEFCRRRISRRILEERYSNLWDREFRQRLWVGRKIQQLFGSAPVSDFAVSAASAFPGLAKFIVSKTHGRPF